MHSWYHSKLARSYTASWPAGLVRNPLPSVVFSMAEIGVDIIEIPRIAGAIERYGDRFLKRVYTAHEIARYRNRVPSLATRFAAKEAVMKVLGCGFRGVGWHDIEILSDPRGKPVVFLHGRAQVRAEALGIREVTVSLSDSKEYAVAMALGN
jgi:holo-[acyl-carrier protein] synthase